MWTLLTKCPTVRQLSSSAVALPETDSFYCTKEKESQKIDWKTSDQLS